MRITIRKTPVPKGISGMTHDRTQRHVCINGQPVYTVAPTNNAWYWHGGFHNTLWEGKTFATREDAIDNVKEFIRQCREATR